MLKLLQYRLRAGALQYAIFISVLIALMVFAFISMTFLQDHFKVKSDSYKQSIHLSQQGIEWGKRTELPYNEEVFMQIDERLNDSTILIKSRWGVFDMLRSNTKIGKEKFQKIALIGGAREEDQALYLQETHNPLVVVGNTKIIGKSYLGELGVKRGSIAGHSFYGEALVYGEVFQSKNTLPELNNMFYLKKTKELLLESLGSEIEWITPGIRLKHSFNKKTKLLYGGEKMMLTDEKLNGNIVVLADSLIVVERYSQLTDVILIADKIVIKEGFEGNLQAFASKAIVIENNSILLYPSALVLTEDENFIPEIQKSNNPKIEIHKNTTIRGLVCYLSELENRRRWSNILIEEGSEVNGQVYCMQYLEVQGKIVGTAYTKAFVSTEFGSPYINHMYNGEIDGRSVPKEYAGLLLEGEKNMVAKWLH